MSLLVLGQYLYAPIESIAFRIHFFIALEASLAIVLFAYLLFLQHRVVREHAHR